MHLPYVKKKRSKRYRRNRFVFVCILLFVGFYLWIESLNDYMEPRLQAIARQDVNLTMNSISQSILRDIDYDPETLIKVDKNVEGNILSVQYDSYTLNQILYTALNTIESSLDQGSDESDQSNMDEVFLKDGAVYDCPIGYLTKIPFLSDVGPTIPLRLKLLNDVTGEIKVHTEAYGINNTLLKVSMSIEVKTQVITVLSTTEIETMTEIPIIVQIVNGKVPDFSPYGNAS